MSLKIDLTGNKYGQLLVIKQVGLTKCKRALWQCLCDCGNLSKVISHSLTSGHTKSCGCNRYAFPGYNRQKHGHAKLDCRQPEFNTWMNIKARCYNKNNSHYKYYGGKGVIVCDRWLGDNGYENFYADMGPRPSKKHSIDRYPDVNGNYDPNNTRWATTKQQNRNKTNNHWIEYKGENLILADWAAKLSIKTSQIIYFLKKGKSMDDIIGYYNNQYNKTA
jgi:hypothetical protein